MKRQHVFLICLIFLLVGVKDTNAEIYTSISGKVIAEDTGKGLANISILINRCPKSNICNTTTKADGTYVFEDISPGDYFLSFEPMDTKYLYEKSPLNVTVLQGKHLTNVNYIMKAGGSISGTVYDADGKTPLSGLTVVARESDIKKTAKYSSFEATITNDEGQYSLHGLMESNTVKVVIEMPGHLNLVKNIEVKKNQTTSDVNFTINKTNLTGISGYVTSLDGTTKIKGALIILENSASIPSASVLSDNNGWFSIIGVPSGQYNAVVIWPDGSGFYTKEGIAVSDGKSTTVDFKFEGSTTISSNKNLLEQLALFLVPEANAAFLPLDFGLARIAFNTSCYGEKAYDGSSVIYRIIVDFAKMLGDIATWDDSKFDPKLRILMNHALKTKVIKFECYNDEGICYLSNWDLPFANEIISCGYTWNGSDTIRLCLQPMFQIPIQCGSCRESKLMHEMLHVSAIKFQPLGLDGTKINEFVAHSCEKTLYGACANLQPNKGKVGCCSLPK